jgi:hypothetical protein
MSRDSPEAASTQATAASTKIPGLADPAAERGQRRSLTEPATDQLEVR